jgi:predicted nucleic acid-binding protein
MTRVVLDTVIVAALIDEHDKWHKPSVAIREALKHIDAEFVLLDPVINEVVSVLIRRVLEQGRAEHLPNILRNIELLAPSERVTWISSETQRLYPQIMALVRTHQGKLNFHDALIALACQELEIQHIVSFDRDFDNIDWLTRIDAPANVPKT